MEQANEIALRQEEIGKKIVNLLTNMKKDGQQRKTPDYINKREDCLTALMEEAEVNHEEFLKLGLPEHNYIKNKYFESIQSKYHEAINHLRTCGGTAQQASTRQPEVLAEMSPQTLRLRKQQVRINQLTSTIEKADDELHQEKTKCRYATLKTKIETQWNNVQELFEETMIHETDEEKAELRQDAQDNLELRVDQILENLQKQISETSNQEKKIPLPKVHLPNFSGGYEEWTTFYDIFEKMIHTNSALSKVEKMQYLKTHIRNEPSKLIQHLYITEGNYETAWEMLCKRYHNKRLIANKFIDKIIDLPQIREENYYQLRHMHDAIHECLEAIKNLGEDANSWGTLVGRIMTRKWDDSTNKLYEQSLQDPHKIQKLAAIMEFLERRCQSLEITIKKDKKTTDSQYNKKDARGPTCTYCQQSHQIAYCEKFQQLSQAEKHKIVQEKKLCYNCLRHDASKQCYSKVTCKKCNRSHHTLLHRETAKPTNQQNKSINNRNTSTAQMDNNKKENIVLLTTAIIRTYTASGNVEHLRVLIDSGSQAALITEQAAQILGHPRQETSTEITNFVEQTTFSRNK